jgi:hypothetical protein
MQEISKKPTFENWVPPTKILAVKDFLEQSGFKTPDLAIPMGEAVGLSKSLSDDWEIHIRIFKDGRVQSHIEVDRTYFEHLSNLRVYTAYEAYEFYRPIVQEFYLKYSPDNEWIKSINETFSITLPPPSTRTPWKPIVGGLAFATIIGIAAYFLTKPPRDEQRENE